MLTLTNRPAALIHRPASATRSFPVTLLRALMVQRSRKALARLSAEQLADIGITRAQADAEARRPLWDAPAHWRG